MATTLKQWNIPERDKKNPIYNPTELGFQTDI